MFQSDTTQNKVMKEGSYNLCIIIFLDEPSYSFNLSANLPVGEYHVLFAVHYESTNDVTRILNVNLSSNDCTAPGNKYVHTMCQYILAPECIHFRALKWVNSVATEHR